MDGFYDALVMDVADPTGQQRVRLQIPQLSGTAVTGWAWPMHRGWAAVGDTVFAAFRGGDQHYPLYMPRSPVSPWYPLAVAAGFELLDPAIGPAPSVRATADGHLDFDGVLTSDGAPPDGSEIVFATIPDSLPAPLYDQSQVAATDISVALSSRSSTVMSVIPGTTTSTAFSSTLTGAADDGPSISFVAPGSGEVIIAVGASVLNSVSTAFGVVSARVSIGGPTGATFLAAIDDNAALFTGSTGFASVMANFAVAGLSSGQTYTATLMYRSSSSSNTTTFHRRTLRVDPVRPYSTPIVWVRANADRQLTAMYPWGGDTSVINLSGLRVRTA
jgi:hypothetical protein